MSAGYIPEDEPIEWAPDRPKPVKGVTAQDPYPYTHTMAAKELGIHRVTLLRMEQQGKIPRAKWRAKPMPHRVYSKDNLTAIRHYLRKQLEKRHGGVLGVRDE